MIASPVPRILRAFRLQRLRLAGVSIKAPRFLAAQIDCHLGFGVDSKGSVAIDDAAWIETNVVLHAFGGNIRIGREVFLGPHTVIYGQGGVTIGDACLIAMHCRIVSSNHAIPAMGTDIRWLPDELRPTWIGRDVWLGAGATVLGGVKIGDGCVVGAGAVVTRNLPDGSIAQGIPARVVGIRAEKPSKV